MHEVVFLFKREIINESLSSIFLILRYEDSKESSNHSRKAVEHIVEFKIRKELLKK